MRVAFVSVMDIMPWGGSEALWSKTAKLALEKNYEVFTSTAYWENTPEKITELARLGARTFFRRGYNPALTMRLFNRIRSKLVKESSEVKALIQFNPDRIVVSQGGSYDLVYNTYLVHYLLSTTKPYYHICHSYDENINLDESKRNLVLQLYNKARKVFMISKSQAHIIARQLLSKSPNIQIVANPVNVKEFTQVPFPPPEKVQFAHIASLHVNIKGHDILLEVLSQEKWQQRNWRLNIYGAGPDKKYIEELILYFHLASKVLLHGHVNDSNQIWQENHLLIISSRKESGPMVLQEAMLSGRPCVATPVGLVREMVQDGINGFVAEAATVKFLDDALERAWQNKQEWEKMGLFAQQSALDFVDLRADETFLNILEQL